MITGQSYPYNKRENMLLVKDDVGKARPSTYNLPPSDFAYGKALPRDKEGASLVSMTWAFHQETRDPQPKRNFQALNKLSLKAGAHQPHHQYEFRKYNDAKSYPKKGKLQIDFALPELEFRYGQKNRPSTPVNYVLGNMFGLDAEIKQITVYQSREQQKKNAGKPLTATRSNRATQLAFESQKAKMEELKARNQKDLFKLNRFKVTKPRTDTCNYLAFQSQVKFHSNQKNSEQPEIAQEQLQDQGRNLKQELEGNGGRREKKRLFDYKCQSLKLCKRLKQPCDSFL